MLWAIALSSLALLVCLPFFLYYKHALRYHLAASYKSMGTLCAFVLALIAAIRLNPHCYICAAALLLHAAADYALEFHFTLGAGLFLAGHICQISFFLSLAPISGTHVIILLLLIVFMAFIYYNWRSQIGKQMPLLAVYGLGLCIMCAFAVSCFSIYALSGILIACGGALFFFSDTLLLRRLLFPSGRSLDWTIMITYYLAQLLFGIACLQL